MDSRFKKYKKDESISSNLIENIPPPEGGGLLGEYY
jgi:hypothetical protein